MIRRLVLVLLAVTAVAVSAGQWWALTLVAPGLVWAWHGRRRGQKVILGQGPREVPVELRRLVFRRDGGCCRYCGRAVHYEVQCPELDDTGRVLGCDLDFEADHVVAYSRGGPTTLDNLVTACRQGNRAKSDRPVGEFIADGGCLAA